MQKSAPPDLKLILGGRGIHSGTTDQAVESIGQMSPGESEKALSSFLGRTASPDDFARSEIVMRVLRNMDDKVIADLLAEHFWADQFVGDPKAQILDEAIYRLRMSSKKDDNTP